MPELTLYHGSEKVVERPVFGYGIPFKDYGRGFYCTESEGMAKEWACQRKTNGFINRYKLDTEELSMLELDKPPYNELNWVAVLLKNKQIDLESDMDRYRVGAIIDRYDIDTTEYDLVEGYRADNSYFQYATMFAQGRLSLEKLRLALRLGGFSTQIALVSEKAFDRIRFVSSETTDPRMYYGKFIERENKANVAFRELSAVGKGKPEGTFIDSLLED